jgi:hypothetical protein
VCARTHCCSRRGRAAHTWRAIAALASDLCIKGNPCSQSATPRPAAPAHHTCVDNANWRSSTLARCHCADSDAHLSTGKITVVPALHGWVRPLSGPSPGPPWLCRQRCAANRGAITCCHKDCPGAHVDAPMPGTASRRMLHAMSPRSAHDNPLLLTAAKRCEAVATSFMSPQAVRCAQHHCRDLCVVHNIIAEISALCTTSLQRCLRCAQHHCRDLCPYGTRNLCTTRRPDTL